MTPKPGKDKHKADMTGRVTATDKVIYKFTRLVCNTPRLEALHPPRRCGSRSPETAHAPPAAGYPHRHHCGSVEDGCLSVCGARASEHSGGAKMDPHRNL